MADFVEGADLDQLPPGQGTTVTVAGKDVALFNVDGKVYAIDDSCLHAAASLGSVELEGKIVRCRAHVWRYDVTTGSTLNVQGLGVAAYPVEVENGKILVAIT
jgi:3-phenylpropionate/trans-cinnamate dioxygenase ferredoxin subunit